MSLDNLSIVVVRSRTTGAVRTVAIVGPNQESTLTTNPQTPTITTTYPVTLTPEARNTLKEEFREEFEKEEEERQAQKEEFEGMHCEVYSNIRVAYQALRRKNRVLLDSEGMNDIGGDFTKCVVKYGSSADDSTLQYAIEEWADGHRDDETPPPFWDAMIMSRDDVLANYGGPELDFPTALNGFKEDYLNDNWGRVVQSDTLVIGCEMSRDRAFEETWKLFLEKAENTYEWEKLGRTLRMGLKEAIEWYLEAEYYNLDRTSQVCLLSVDLSQVKMDYRPYKY